MNISAITTISDTPRSLVVSPIDSPTVENALIVSNTIGRNCSRDAAAVSPTDWTALSAKKLTVRTSSASKRIPIVRSTVPEGIARCLSPT